MRCAVCEADGARRYRSVDASPMRIEIGRIPAFHAAEHRCTDCSGVAPWLALPVQLGHIVSYSLAGAAHIFAPAGFNVIELPGRAWAFLAECGPQHPVDTEALMARLWHPVPENIAMLRSARFGGLIRAAGIEAARAYLPGR
jgi:hypothetical protein